MKSPKARPHRGLTRPHRGLKGFLPAARAAVVPAAAALWAALGTFWTIFAWYHQEIVVPSTAPVNLTTEVTLERVGQQSSGKLDSVLLSVTATNVSGKNVHLLRNYWDAWAGKVNVESNGADNSSWLKDINAQEASRDFSYATRAKYYNVSGLERVAWGNLFPDTYVLSPKETVSASVVFYVPRDAFDLVHVEVHIPTTPKSGVIVQFLVDQERVKPKFFKIAPDGSQEEITGQSGMDDLRIQETQARKQLALSRSDVTTPLKATSAKVPVPSP
jgi:hypothetical protein